MNIADHIIREGSITTVSQYRRRVVVLAFTYVLLFLCCFCGVAVLAKWSKLFVTLSQRTNVETLTIAFFLIFFAYLGLLSTRGALGGLRIFWYWSLSCVKGSVYAEQRKVRALGPARSAEPPSVALNICLVSEDDTNGPIKIPIRDEVSSMGTLVIDGARVFHEQAVRNGSNTLFVFFQAKINECLAETAQYSAAAPASAKIVEWRRIDDEETDKYLSHVQFARNLERHFGDVPLWPRAVLPVSQLQRLEKLFSQLCPALRTEAFLPDWEYSGEHKLPIIPEPLGLVSLSRSEKRVDPMASMGACLLIVVIALFLAILMVKYPPWVPG